MEWLVITFGPWPLAIASITGGLLCIRKAWWTWRQYFYF